MSGPRFDFRKTLREIATRAQDANLDRLLSAQAVRGGEIAPQRPHEVSEAQGRRKRVRVFGVRIALSDLAGRLGVKSGEMLKDLTRRANIKIGRTSFKIIPSPEVALKWRAFVSGSKHQIARPVSGLSSAQISEATALLAQDARNQTTAQMQTDLEAARNGES